MDDKITATVRFTAEARSATDSFNKSYEVHLQMVKRALRPIVYNVLQQHYVAAETYAAQRNQPKTLIVSFQRGLHQILQWSESEKRRFIQSIGIEQGVSRAVRLPADILNTITSLLHVLMYTDSEVTELVEQGLTHCPGFEVRAPTTAGDFIVQCVHEAAYHFDGTPLLFSRAFKSETWIENRQKIFVQIDQIIELVTIEMATNMVRSVCKRLLESRCTRSSHHSSAAAAASNVVASVTLDNASSTSSAPAQGEQRGEERDGRERGGRGDREEKGQDIGKKQRENEGERETRYTDTKLLGGHADDQEYLEHQYNHGTFRNTSTPVRAATSSTGDSGAANVTGLRGRGARRGGIADGEERGAGRGEGGGDAPRTLKVAKSRASTGTTMAESSTAAAATTPAAFPTLAHRARDANVATMRPAFPLTIAPVITEGGVPQQVAAFPAFPIQAGGQQKQPQQQQQQQPQIRYIREIAPPTDMPYQIAQREAEQRAAALEKAAREQREKEEEERENGTDDNMVQEQNHPDNVNAPHEHDEPAVVQGAAAAAEEGDVQTTRKLEKALPTVAQETMEGGIRLVAQAHVVSRDGNNVVEEKKQQQKIAAPASTDALTSSKRPKPSGEKTLGAEASEKSAATERDFSRISRILLDDASSTKKNDKSHKIPMISTTAATAALPAMNAEGGHPAATFDNHEGAKPTSVIENHPVLTAFGGYTNAAFAADNTFPLLQDHEAQQSSQ